jgi:hypothetical protein
MTDKIDDEHWFHTGRSSLMYVYSVHELVMTSQYQSPFVPFGCVSPRGPPLRWGTDAAADLSNAKSSHRLVSSPAVSLIHSRTRAKRTLAAELVHRQACMSSEHFVCRQSISDSWLGNLRECLAQYPSCLISWTHSGPVGGRSAGEGRQGSMKPAGVR